MSQEREILMGIHREVLWSVYIPNMTRRDGSALEEMFAGDINKKGSPE